MMIYLDRLLKPETKEESTAHRYCPSPAAECEMLFSLFTVILHILIVCRVCVHDGFVSRFVALLSCSFSVPCRCTEGSCPVEVHSGKPYFSQISCTSLVQPALQCAKPRSIVSQTYILCIRLFHVAFGGIRSISLCTSSFFTVDIR